MRPNREHDVLTLPRGNGGYWNIMIISNQYQTKKYQIKIRCKYTKLILFLNRWITLKLSFD